MWLQLVLFMVYYSSITVFIHVHIENGTAIVHAHPYQKTSDGTCHHHSSMEEILLFSTLTTINAADGAVHPLELRFLATYISEIKETPVYPDYLVSIPGKLSLRAPPVL